MSSLMAAGVGWDYVKASRLFRLLAANGSAQGQFYIGLMYDQGKEFRTAALCGALGQALARLRVLNRLTGDLPARLLAGF